ncbi:MAG: DMT family transporter [Pseudomonadota bacterium]
MSDDSPKRLGAFGLLLVMGAAWGATLSLAKIAVAEGGHPIGLAQWVTTCSGLFLLLAATLSGRLSRPNRQVARFSAVCGLVGSVLPALAMFAAAKHLAAGVLAISLATMPLMTYGLSVLLRVERAQRRRLLGVLLGLAAVALMVAPETSLPQAGLAPWVLLALTGSFGYACENLFIALRRPPGLDGLMLACGRQIAAALMLTPVALGLGVSVPLVAPWGALQWSVSAMAALTAVAFTCFLHVIRTAGPVFASQTAYIITIAGVLWGMALFGERHSPWIWAALALMLAGLSLVRPRAGRDLR